MRPHRNCGLPVKSIRPSVGPSIMLLPELRDLIKPPWRKLLEELKRSGGMPVGGLAQATGASYMAVKTQCEDLTRAGYLVRTRVARTEVGRPEVFYSLAAKADGLFPQAGTAFTLELLDAVRALYGESAPERLLFQHFDKTGRRYAKALAKCTNLAERAAKLAALREKDGCTSVCETRPGQPPRLVECHHPLARIFERHPRAVAMEHRMLEQLLGSKLTRRELAAGREAPPRVIFEIS